MKIWHVDAFTREPFGGNPAAVVLLDTPLDDARLAELTAEFNLPATVFLRRSSDVAWSIRWFTPRESNLCGHGTLASAHVLWESGLATGATIALESRSGNLWARREGDRIQLDFPTLHLPPRPPSPALATPSVSAPRRRSGRRAVDQDPRGRRRRGDVAWPAPRHPAAST